MFPCVISVIDVTSDVMSTFFSDFRDVKERVCSMLTCYVQNENN